MMPDDIAGGVPVSISGGNPWVFLSRRFFCYAKKSDDWENLPSIGEKLQVGNEKAVAFRLWHAATGL
ncbi:hypothetical protein [Sphingobium yanoikuyae]|uniref:hypothetical protein n=2 Tax=Sphingobium yanoikuyae TaxID=13690 RepID=UPI002FDA5D33